MSENIYHYVISLPDGVDEAVLACADGYTIYTADRLGHEERLKAYRHALAHIQNNDFFSPHTVAHIENERH